MRHLGYPAQAVTRVGQGSPSQLRDYGINNILEDLDSRLEEMTVVGEAILTGACIGSVAIVGLDPSAGDTITLIVTSTDLQAPVTVSAEAAEGDDKFTFGTKLTAALAQNAQLAGAGFAAGGPYQGSAVFDKNLNPQVELKAFNPFALTVAFSGSVAASVTSQGVQVEPSVVVEKQLGQSVTRWGYLPILNWLQGAIGAVTQNSAVAKAGTYVRGQELKERRELMAYWRTDLSNFLEIPIYGSRSGGGGFYL